MKHFLHVLDQFVQYLKEQNGNIWTLLQGEMEMRLAFPAWYFFLSQAKGFGIIKNP